MYQYPYVDDPEPKERPETTEDKVIRHGRRIFNILLTVAGCALLVLFIYGVILRHL